MTERYLLDELDPKLRDEFEEHYFDCPDCALDVRAGTEFLVHSKDVLAESPEVSAVSGARLDVHPARSGWFSWLRPAFAAPALALLLLVIGYQNWVMYPKLQSALKQPRVLPWASVTVGTWGANEPTITVAQGMGFLLFVRIPPDGTYARYMADLYDSRGKLESSVAIPVIGQQDQWPVVVPGNNRESGSYKLVIRGLAAAGESKEIGSASFTLQIQK